MSWKWFYFPLFSLLPWVTMHFHPALLANKSSDLIGWNRDRSLELLSYCHIVDMDLVNEIKYPTPLPQWITAWIVEWIFSSNQSHVGLNKKKMAANGDRSRAEIQEEIKKQGELVRNLKLQERTDVNKAQVCVSLSFIFTFRRLFLWFLKLGLWRKKVTLWNNNLGLF